MTTASTIILIGPMSAGKSTIAALLADKLGLPHCALDDGRWGYYDETSYDKQTAAEIMAEQGMLGLLHYMKPYEAHAVERVLADHKGSVIDFGAGHSVHEDEPLFKRVQHALAPFEHVILLLPSPDLDASVDVLNARFRKLLEEEVGEVDEALLGLNEHFVKHASNHQLATMVVYTDSHTPEETCEEILEILSA
ncbi:MAG: shikimate kinase [Anaerolineae bacterium]|nr:shikimate kinase [Anaerolineae bacterium]